MLFGVHGDASEAVIRPWRVERGREESTQRARRVHGGHGEWETDILLRSLRQKHSGQAFASLRMTMVF